MASAALGHSIAGRTFNVVDDAAYCHEDPERVKSHMGWEECSDRHLDHVVMKRSTEFRRPTIKDVASLSGVSQATVSNVLRETGSVSDATRARVLESIATLGYRPNATARNLVRRRSSVLGVLAGNFGNAFEAELVEEFEQAAWEQGFAIIVCTTGRRPELEANRIESLLEHPVAGIAMLQFSGDRGLMSQLFAERVPFVMVSCWDDHAGLRRGR